MVQRRRLRLLLISQDRMSILSAAGELPPIDVELDEGETTIAAASRVLPTIGLAGPVLDCFVDQSDNSADDREEIIAALVELTGPPDRWVPPAGWVFIPLSAPAPGVEPGLRPAIADRLAQLRGDRPVPDLRVPWAMAGWYERAANWTGAALADQGRPPATSIVQVRHWGISAVMRVETPAGSYWFKASSRVFRNEAAITACLHRAAPMRVTPVVAVDPDQGWLLMEEIDGMVVGEDREPTRAAFESLADVQADLVGHGDALRAAGCPHRPIRELPETLRRTLASPLVNDMLALSSKRVDQVIATLANAVDEVDGLGIPDSLVHGDFHPGNVISTSGGITIFDWSDAAVSNPLVDVATWASWFTDDQNHIDAIYRTFHEVRGAKLGHELGTELDQLGQGTLAAVAGAYHLISYAGILEATEPHRRVEHADGIGDFFALLDAATPS